MKLDENGKYIIINLTIVECKLGSPNCWKGNPVDNKSNHSGM